MVENVTVQYQSPSMSLNRLRIVYEYPIGIYNVSRKVFLQIESAFPLASRPDTTWNGLM